MGVLASHLPLSPEFEQLQLFPALCDSECTVRDWVRLAMSCKAAHEFVTWHARFLSRPQLERLLLSLPSRVQRREVGALKVGDLVWERIDDNGEEDTTVAVRLIRLESAATTGHFGDTWGTYENYATVLAIATNITQVNPAWNRHFPMFQPAFLQWYPLLDPALRLVCARLMYVAETERAPKRQRVY